MFKPKSMQTRLRNTEIEKREEIYNIQQLLRAPC